VPRRSKRAADEEALTPANGTHGSSPDAPNPEPQQIVKVVTAIEPVEPTALENVATDASPAPVGPRLEPDPGLYAVLGLEPSVSDAEIQTTYRRLAARLQSGGPREQAAMRQLNVA